MINKEKSKGKSDIVEHGHLGSRDLSANPGSYSFPLPAGSYRSIPPTGHWGKGQNKGEVSTDSNEVKMVHREVLGHRGIPASPGKKIIG